MRDGQMLITETIHIGKLKTAIRARVEDDWQIDQSLPGRLKDAKAELEQAWHMDIGNMGYPSEAGCCEKIPSTGTGAQETMSQWQLDRLALFRRWSAMTPHKGIAFDICYRGLNYVQCGYERGLDRRTVARRFRAALECWADLRGWPGEQSSPPHRARAQLARAPRDDFRASRIIIMIDA